MYVVTFYSFKGGVGRTQALVNVGAELVQRGRRVLLVDFDLEAPGIDTYKLPRPQRDTPGIVEFMIQYLREGVAPDASSFIYESLKSDNGGQMWVMPSGQQNESYGSQLSGIDWLKLYTQNDGYLLLEDLKLQWSRTLSPDYVLIDSRTGHTDVGGLCTRQLPDSVVIVFFPNQQNLVGLPKIVSDIRAEASTARQKKIGLHFVMSNVPMLDDEEQILKNQASLFRESLRYSRLAQTIYRYDSLALLNQTVFTVDRPKTRLAHEYRRLTDAIVESNMRDRDGALRFLSRVATERRHAGQFTAKEVESRIEEAQEAHPNDPDVLLAVSTLRMAENRWKEALPLLDRSADHGLSSAALWLARGEARFFSGNQEGAAEDLRRVLDSADVEDYQVSRAFRLLREVDPRALKDLALTRGLSALDPESQLWIAQQLGETDEELVAAATIARALAEDDSQSAEVRSGARGLLGRALIGLGNFDEAVSSLEIGREGDIAKTFNLAFALWGKEGVPPRSLFEEVLELDTNIMRGSVPSDPNYNQCIALAAGVCGKTDDAHRRLDAARSRVVMDRLPVFSCWSYKTVPPNQFLNDLTELLQFIDTGTPLPFAVQQASLPT